MSGWLAAEGPAPAPLAPQGSPLMACNDADRCLYKPSRGEAEERELSEVLALRSAPKPALLLLPVELPVLVALRMPLLGGGIDLLFLIKSLCMYLLRM